MRTLVVGLRVHADAQSVRVRATKLGSTLLRVARVDNGTARARLIDDNRIADVQVFPDGRTAGTVEVLVDSAVLWSVTTDGQVDDTDIDLSSAAVSSVTLAPGGSGNADVRLALPQPVGTTKVRIAGSVDECDVRTPRAVPARITVGSGPSDVFIDGRRQDIDSGRTELSIGEPDRSARSIDFHADRVSELRWDRS